MFKQNYTSYLELFKMFKTKSFRNEKDLVIKKIINILSILK